MFKTIFGEAGTGKSFYLAKLIVECFENGDDFVVLTATHKSLENIYKICQSINYNIDREDFKTIYSFFRIDYVNEIVVGARHLPKTIFIDEIGLVNVNIFEKCLDTINEKINIVVAGDVLQLNPIYKKPVEISFDKLISNVNEFINEGIIGGFNNDPIMTNNSGEIITTFLRSYKQYYSSIFSKPYIKNGELIHLTTNYRSGELVMNILDWLYNSETNGGRTLVKENNSEIISEKNNEETNGEKNNSENISEKNNEETNGGRTLVKENNSEIISEKNNEETNGEKNNSENISEKNNEETNGENNSENINENISEKNINENIIRFINTDSVIRKIKDGYVFLASTYGILQSIYDHLYSRMVEPILQDVPLSVGYKRLYLQKGMELMITTTTDEFYNGQLVIFEEIIDGKLKCIDEGGDYVMISSDTHYPVSPSNLLTIHKSQGLSIDDVIVCVDNLFDMSLLYTAITRCRNNIYFFSQGIHPMKTLLKNAYKDEISQLRLFTIKK